ncbi:MAG: winged helix-turn-helix domain-containing protein [Rubrivivax sp.]|nr:winged helix-turn-helix domain-containing protein [Rubrivivax sp.]
MLTLEPGSAAVLARAAGAAALVSARASVSWPGRSPSGPAQGALHGHAAADRAGAGYRPQFDIAGSAIAEPTLPAAASAPVVEVYMLGPFRVFANDRAIDEWPHGKGKAIFKYLAAHRARPVPREVLMDVFWPDAGPGAARNNLNVAIHGLRKALARADADHAFVLFAQGCYSLDPALRLWIDAEAFIAHLQRGRAAEQRGDTAAAMAEYRIAQAIHHRPLLVEDRYESWLVPHRQRLRGGCVELLNRLAEHAFDQGDFETCVAFAHKLLEVDNCDEQAHRLLMRCYSRMGHVHLALRQYHFCVDTLARELDLIPGPPTVALSRQLRQRQAI